MPRGRDGATQTRARRRLFLPAKRTVQPPAAKPCRRAGQHRAAQQCASGDDVHSSRPPHRSILPVIRHGAAHGAHVVGHQR